MLDVDSLFEELDRIGLESWRPPLSSLIRERLADGAHGHLAQWREVIASLSATILTEQDRTQARTLLKQLAPWRKGPFLIQGIDIDSEWRSDMKWDRLKNNITPLAGRNILDVGCGNGYYALRMLEAGAKCVVGIAPGILFVCQFEAIKKLAAIRSAYVLPLRLEDPDRVTIVAPPGLEALCALLKGIEGDRERIVHHHAFAPAGSAFQVIRIQTSDRHAQPELRAPREDLLDRVLAQEVAARVVDPVQVLGAPERQRGQ